MMASDDRKIALEFKQRLGRLVRVLELRAFGSRARGDAATGSDLDIFLVVDRIDADLRERISELAWKVGFGKKRGPVHLRRHLGATEVWPGRSQSDHPSDREGGCPAVIDERLRELFTLRVQQVTETLREARVLLAERAPRGAVSRRIMAN